MAGVGISYIINILLIVHVLRTGRPYFWVFIIMWPVVGPVAYFLVELLPEIANDYRAKRAIRGIRRTIDPDADLRRHQKQNRISDNVDAKRHLAAELVAAERYDEAVDHYSRALSGIYEYDPDLMLGLATALFGKGDYEKARATMDELKEKNPTFKSPTGHLLYARIVEACGDADAAMQEYEVVSESYPGPEAKVRFARFLEDNDQIDRARTVYEDILNTVELAPRHVKKTQREWINAAKDGLRRLTGD